MRKETHIILTLSVKPDILNTPCSRGSGGALYLKSAIAGVMF